MLHHEGDGWAVWYGFGLEFVRDRGGVVRNCYKDGINAGASGILRYYPDVQLDILSNSSVGAPDVIDEIHRLVQTQHPVVGVSGF